MVPSPSHLACFLDTWSCVPRVETRTRARLTAFLRQVSVETEMERASGGRWTCARPRVHGSERGPCARVDRESVCEHPRHTRRVLHTGLPDYRINISDDIARAHL